MRFSAEQVKSSFIRLRQNIVEGKSGVERTSALMYFLAYDAVGGDQAPITLDPNTAAGRANRDELTREYCRLVTVRVIGPREIWSITDLGLVTRNGNTPAKRISSNFLTVPLKKASHRSSVVAYPNRPRPLLNLGNGLGVGGWGIAPHPAWKTNLPVFLSERITKWPFTDLAIFVLRDSDFTRRTSLQETIESLLSDRFSIPLSSFWIEQIGREFKYRSFEPSDPWVRSNYHKVFEDKEWITSISNEDEVSLLDDRVHQLETRISYLEEKLDENNIPYEKD